MKIFDHSVVCHFFWKCPLPYRAFQLYEVSFINWWSYCLCYQCSVQKVFSVRLCSRLVYMLYSFRFRVHGLMLRPIIHLELNFVQDNRYETISTLPHSVIQLNQHRLLKMLLFLSLWLVYQKLGGHEWVWIYVWDCSLIPLINKVFYDNSMLLFFIIFLWYNLKSEMMTLPTVLLLCRIVLASLCFCVSYEAKKLSVQISWKSVLKFWWWSIEYVDHFLVGCWFSL